MSTSTGLRAAHPPSGMWQAEPGFGIYVHVPFCMHRCHYCDFNTYEGLDALFEPYVNALITEIARSEHPRPATSVFFGGGTPTLLAARDLGRVLDAIAERFGIVQGAEITAEANPDTIDASYLRSLRKVGFNRLSIGVQSLAPGVLARLGRTHSAERALEAVADARRAGFDDVNVDLIYGSPWECADDWMHSLTGVIEAGPEHVSAYALTVEEGTPLHTMVASGRLTDVNPDIQAARFRVADAVLGKAGYVRYEISNWSTPGHASRHNVLYWSAGDYFGFGAGAHSHIGGRRWWSTRRPRDYIAAVTEGRSTTAGEEILDDERRAGEALMLGLRLVAGIDLDSFRRRFGDESLEARHGELSGLRSAGLIEESGVRLCLSDEGTLLANEVVSRLL